MADGVLSVLGPTASGKSAVAMRLAAALNGEIVSCDSMQVYRGLDIGTAKPTAAEQAAIRHLLIDVADIDERYDLRRFHREASAAIADILARGRQPILCGGTGLYAKALLYGFHLQPGDPAVAAAVRAAYTENGAEPLLAEIAGIDPDTAARVADNHRRLLRAVEIVRITGEPIRHEQPVPPSWARSEFVLVLPPERTRKRVAARCREMLASGWVEETEHLVTRGLLDTPTASQALGYREIATYLNGDIGSIEELAEAITTLTCRYAKRQRTWFRGQHPKAIRLPVNPDDAADTVAERIRRRLPA